MTLTDWQARCERDQTADLLGHQSTMAMSIVVVSDSSAGDAGLLFLPSSVERVTLVAHVARVVGRSHQLAAGRAAAVLIADVKRSR